MAKIYIDNINSEDKRRCPSTGTPYVNPFKRTDAFPLDRTELFDSLEDAQLYANGGADKRGLSGTSYPGQIISVVVEDKTKDPVVITVTPYQIQGDGTLKKIGGDTEAEVAELKTRVDNIDSYISKIDGDASTEGSFRKGDADTLASAKAYTTEEIGKLDLTAVTYEGAFISSVSQTDGKVAASYIEFGTVTSTGKVAPKASAVYSYVGGNVATLRTEINTAYNNAKSYTSSIIDALDLDETGSDGNYIQKVKQENGKVTVTTKAFDKEITASSTDNNTPTSKTVYSYVGGNVATLRNEINTAYNNAKTYTSSVVDALDLAAVTYTDGFISSVSQTNGKVAAVATKFDTTISASSNIAPTSGTVYSYVGGNVATLRSEINTAYTNAKTYAETKATEAYNTAKAYTTEELGKLDLSETGAATGKFIKLISQTDGKVSATAESFDTTVSASSTDDKAPTSKAVASYVAGEIAGVKAAVDNLNGTYTVSAGQFISTVKQEKGQVSATYTDFASLVTSDGAIAPKASAVYTYVGGAYVGLVAGINQALKDAKTYTSNIVNALDATITVSTGYAFTSITQTDGKISAYTEAKIPEYTIVKSADSGSYTSVYRITKDGTAIGDAINIPKDMVIKAAAVIDYNGTDTKITIGGVEYNVEGTHAKGKYIVMIVNNAERGASQVWLDVKDLVDVYTIQEGSKNYLNIDSYHAIGAHVDVDKGLSSYAWSNAVYAYAGEAYTYSKTEITNINTAYTNLKTYVTNVVAKKADDAYAYAGEAYTYSKVEVARIDSAYTDLKTYVTNVVAKKADDAYTYASNIGHDLDSAYSYSTIAIGKLETSYNTLNSYIANTVTKNVDKAQKRADDAYTYATNIGHDLDSAYSYSTVAIGKVETDVSTLNTYVTGTVAKKADDAYTYATNIGHDLNSAYSYSTVAIGKLETSYNTLNSYIANTVAPNVDKAQKRADDAYTYATNIGHALDDLSTKVSGVSYTVSAYNSYNIAITKTTSGSTTDFEVKAVVKDLDKVDLSGSDNQGLATAYNVAYTIIANEKTTAAALTNLNTRLSTLEDSKAVHAYTYASIAYERANAAYAYAGSAYTYAGQVGAVADKKVASIAYSSNCGLSVTYSGTAYTVTLNSETTINTASTDNDTKLANIGAIKSYVSTTYNAALDVAKAQLSYVYAANVGVAQSTYTSGYVTTKVAAKTGTAGSHTQDICVDLTMGSFGYTSGSYSVTTDGLMSAYQIVEMINVMSAWEEY